MKATATAENALAALKAHLGKSVYSEQLPTPDNGYYEVCGDVLHEPGGGRCQTSATITTVGCRFNYSVSTAKLLATHHIAGKFGEVFNLAIWWSRKKITNLNPMAPTSWLLKYRV